MKRIRFVFLASLLLVLHIVTAQPVPSTVWEFKVNDAWGRDTVQFLTAAPLEDIVGTTNQIKLGSVQSGRCYLAYGLGVCPDAGRHRT